MATYYCNHSTLSRGDNCSAASKFRYICRLGKYANKGDLIAVHSANMPSWAVENPLAFWEAADAYERVNGRLCEVVEFALPCELGRETPMDMAVRFADAIATTDDGQRLPYTMALHWPPGSRNCHGHLTMSTRIADGIERTPQEFFSRATPKPKPGQPPPKRKGGARKTTSTSHPEWLRWVRETLADLINFYYEQAGLPHRVDHRSYAEQGVNKIPQEHLGPKLAAIAKKLEDADIDIDDYSEGKLLRNAIIKMVNEQGVTLDELEDAIKQQLDNPQQDGQQEEGNEVSPPTPPQDVEDVEAAEKVDGKRRFGIGNG